MFHLNTYVLGLRLLEIFYFFQRGDRIYTSESADVSYLYVRICRRQILTYKYDPRAERVNLHFKMLTNP